MPTKKGRASSTPKRGPGAPVKFTSEMQQRFCRLYSAGGTVRMAARKCGVTNVTVFEHARKDDNFKEMYERARELNLDGLEDDIRTLACNGNLTAMFGMLRAFRSERWRENYKVDHEHRFLTSAEDLQVAQQRAKQREPVPPPEARH